MPDFVLPIMGGSVFVCLAAVAILLTRTPKWKSKNDWIRCCAVRRMSNEARLKWVLSNDPDYGVRDAAIHRLLELLGQSAWPRPSLKSVIDVDILKGAAGVREFEVEAVRRIAQLGRDDILLEIITRFGDGLAAALAAEAIQDPRIQESESVQKELRKARKRRKEWDAERKAKEQRAERQSRIEEGWRMRDREVKEIGQATKDLSALSRDQLWSLYDSASSVPGSDISPIDREAARTVLVAICERHYPDSRVEVAIRSWKAEAWGMSLLPVFRVLYKNGVQLFPEMVSNLMATEHSRLVKWRHVLDTHTTQEIDDSPWGGWNGYYKCRDEYRQVCLIFGNLAPAIE